MDIENMADYDDLKSTEATDTEDYDEWKDNLEKIRGVTEME